MRFFLLKLVKLWLLMAKRDSRNKSDSHVTSGISKILFQIFYDSGLKRAVRAFCREKQKNAK